MTSYLRKNKILTFPHKFLLLLLLMIYICFFQKVLTDRDSEHGDSDQDISANGSPMTRKRGM